MILNYVSPLNNFQVVMRYLFENVIFFNLYHFPCKVISALLNEYRWICFVRIRDHISFEAIDPART